MMQKNIDISVVIPVYGAEATVEGTVRSILAQGSCEYEIILVDDGSKDDSGKVCDALAAEEARIKVLHQKNSGVSAARNAGISMASGTYVMFADADDFLREGAFAELYREDCDFIVGGFEKVYADGSREEFCSGRTEAFKGGAVFDILVRGRNFYLLNSPCFKLFRRSLIEEHGLRFVEGLSYAEDKIFVLNFLCHVKDSFVTDEIVYSYMIQNESLSSDLSSDRHLSQLLVLLKEYSLLIPRLEALYPDSSSVRMLYHDDFISGYVCRILTVFMLRRSSIMTNDTLRLLYAYMDRDKYLSLFSIRAGQILNIALYKIGSVKFSAAVYRLSSSVVEGFRKLINCLS